MKRRFDSNQVQRNPQALARASHKTVMPRTDRPTAASRQLMIAMGWVQLFRAIISPATARRG